jgi:hypothetical protein
MLLEDVEKFRQKGALSPEKAVSIEKLKLSPECKILIAGNLGAYPFFRG